MSRQYYGDVLTEPHTASGTALVATTEELMWAPADYTRIGPWECKTQKIFEVHAGGIMTWAATGTLLITPRMGLLISSPTLGVSVTAQTTPGIVTAAAWSLYARCIIRTVGASGANSTAFLTGDFWSQGVGTLGTTVHVAFGGTVATFDASIATGIAITKTLSVAGSMTVGYAFIRSLN